MKQTTTRAPRTTPTPTISNEGQRLLRLVLRDRSLQEVATPLGVSRQAVKKWDDGAEPDAQRRRLLAQHWGIPVDAWGRPPGAERPERPVRDTEPAPAGELGSSLDIARDHLIRVQQARADAEAEGNPEEVRKWLQIEHTALTHVAKLRGDLSPADETRLTLTPRWVAVRTAILEALRAHPEALKDVVRALREIDAMR